MTFGWHIFEVWSDGETVHTCIYDAPETEDTEPWEDDDTAPDLELSTISKACNARQDIFIREPMKAIGKRLPNGAWVPAREDDRVPMNNGRARRRDDGSVFFIAFCPTCDHEHEITLPGTPVEASARVSAGMYSLGHPVLPCAEHKKAP